jgi:hypothetical protein
MTGPEHYREAERLDAGVQRFVDLAKSTADAGNADASEAAKWAANHILARAQVHATLALAAATAAEQATAYDGDEARSRGWAGVA